MLPLFRRELARGVGGAWDAGIQCDERHMSFWGAARAVIPRSAATRNLLFEPTEKQILATLGMTGKVAHSSA